MVLRTPNSLPTRTLLVRLNLVGNPIKDTEVRFSYTHFAAIIDKRVWRGSNNFNSTIALNVRGLNER